MGNEIKRNSMEYEEIDLVDLLRYFLKHWLVICLCTILGLVASGLYTRYLVNPKYSSSALVYIRGVSNTITSVADIQIGYYLTDDYVIIFKSRTVMENVINRLGLKNISAGQLSNMVSVTGDLGRNILKISATTSDPNLSRDVVNAVVDYGADMVKEINTKEPYVIERAIANPNKVSPSLTKNVAIGGIIGLAIALVACTISYLVNDRIESIEMIENKIGIPVIGLIPESPSLTYDKGKTRKKKKKHKKDPSTSGKETK